MLTGNVIHNQLLEQTDSLQHNYLSAYAELVGAVADISHFQNTPCLLAQYIWTRFNNSAKHAAIQGDIHLRYVSVSCCQKYFVVRLNDSPSAVLQDNYKRKQIQSWIENNQIPD